MTYRELLDNFSSKIDGNVGNAISMLSFAFAVDKIIPPEHFGKLSFEEVCDRLYTKWLMRDCSADIDDFVYNVEDMIDEGFYEEINTACINAAYNSALNDMRERLG